MCHIKTPGERNGYGDTAQLTTCTCGLLFGRECYDADKGVTIHDRIMLPLGARPEQVLFCDDNMDNLHDAARVCNTPTFHVTGSVGLTPEMCDHIRAWAQ